MIEKLLKKIRVHKINPAKHLGTEFEVDNWNISRFVLKHLVAKTGYHPFPLSELSLMASAVCYFTPTDVFEWGTHIGKSALVFHTTAKYYGIDSHIHSIDLPDDSVHNEHPGSDRGKLVRGVAQVTLYQGDGLDTSIEILRTLPSTARPLFFVDGDHSYESVKRELTGILTAAPHAAVLLHDTFYQSKESNYNIGPFEAINDVLSALETKYKRVSTVTGLPGMTLIYPYEQ